MDTDSDDFEPDPPWLKRLIEKEEREEAEKKKAKKETHNKEKKEKGRQKRKERDLEDPKMEKKKKEIPNLQKKDSKKEDPSTSKVEGKEVPFWWNQKVKEMSKVLSVKNRKEKEEATMSGKVAWTKQYSSKSTWKSSVHFSEENVKAKIKKEVVHKTNRSEKELKEDEIYISRKILLKPTVKQKLIIQKWMRITRFVYNNALEWVKKKKCSCDFEKLRFNLLSKERNPETDKYEWLFDNKLCPRQAKDEALHEFVSSVHSSERSLKENKIKKKPEMKKRTEKDHQRVHIPTSGKQRISVKWNDEEFSFWPNSKLGPLKVRQKRELKRLSKLEASKESHARAILKYESPGRYYMIILSIQKKKKKISTGRIVALDPGVNQFQVGFDNHGNFTEFGKGDINRIFKESIKCDKIQSRISSFTQTKEIPKEVKKSFKNHKKEKSKKQLKKKRQRLKKKYKKHQNRIQGLKETFHKNLCHQLCQEYDHILIPKFQVSGMIKKWERKIKSVVVRKMLNWSHFSFRQRLLHHSEKEGIRIHEVSEHFTVRFLLFTLRARHVDCVVSLIGTWVERRSLFAQVVDYPFQETIMAQEIFF
jgi:transposase